MCVNVRPHAWLTVTIFKVCFLIEFFKSKKKKTMDNISLTSQFTLISFYVNERTEKAVWRVKRHCSRSKSSAFLGHPNFEQIFQRRLSHPRSRGLCLTRLHSNLFIRLGMLKKKALPNLKGAPVVYLILLCGPIRCTGAERTTIWRKWRIHYLVKGVNS